MGRAGVCLALSREVSGTMHPCSGLDLEVHLQEMTGCSPCCPVLGDLPKAGEPCGEACLFFPPARNWTETNYPSDGNSSSC